MAVVIVVALYVSLECIFCMYSHGGSVCSTARLEPSAVWCPSTRDPSPGECRVVYCTISYCTISACSVLCCVLIVPHCLCTRVGHTSPGSKSVSSQQSAPIGVNQLREMMASVERNTDNNTVKNTARNTGNNTVEKNTGSTVQNSVKDTVLDPPKELKVQPAVPENEVNRGGEVNLPTPEKEVRKVRKVPPQPPGLIFIDGSNPPKRFQNEVIRSEPPPPLTVRSEMSDKKEVNEVTSVLSEEQSLLEEKKRIQKKMQKKMNVLEARNRERSRSRSRGRGYGSRRNSGTVEGAEDRSVLEDEERIVENHSEHRAPSGYHEAGADDAQSMFSAGSGGKRSVHKGRPDLPALPATAQKGELS